VIDFQSLYDAHARTVFRFAQALSGDRALADDITSETFVRAWTARERVDLTTVIGYLLTIARHLYLEDRRRGQRHAALDVDPADAAPGPHALAAGRAELDAVLADLQALPEADRAAVLMRAEDRMSYQEIGAALGLSPGTVKVKVHRARRRLAEQRLERERRTP
jgi:RNA polymerase sigma-70 factor (ECF subfamily)